jgi:transcriptional regulator with XRE-family HTH domain
MCDIGRKMYQRRKELGLTLEEVGDAVGVGKSTVRRWENGMIKNMGRDKIAALARVLRMSPVEFVPGDSPSDLDAEDQQRLEALHQNPQLGLLFDRSRKMSEADVEFMLQMADRILKERGD